MTYGLPYKGSKNKIAQWIVDQLPPAENFYDLFGGGGAVTHCAMLSGKWRYFFLNDIRQGLTECFAMAMNGEYQKPEYRRWISREEFNVIRHGTTHSDCYFSLLWSFGSDMESYMFDKREEAEKRELYEAMLAGQDVGGKRMQVLERMRRVQGLEALWDHKSWFFIGDKCSDYEVLPIDADSVVYCDIPYAYRSTFSHCKNFDHAGFYKWCAEAPVQRHWHSRNVRLYISEYSMPEGFTAIAQREKFTSSAYKKRKYAMERLFVPDGQEMHGQQELFG